MQDVDDGSGERAGDAGPQGSTPRSRLVELLQDYADEAGRLGQAFAAEQGLHRTDAAALLAVLRAERAGDPLTAGRLGEEVGLSSGATTAAVDRLERLGHLHRVRDDVDRRRVTLHHDATGADVGRAWFGPLAARLDAVLAGYTPAELAVVHRFLIDVVASVAEHRAEMTDSRGMDGRGMDTAQG